MPDAAIADMVDALYADMPPERQARIVARADGIPLFAEELAAMAQERELPANLHDLLMVRLDSLGPARTIAQLAATVGREFDLDFLASLPPAIATKALKSVITYRYIAKTRMTAILRAEIRLAGLIVFAFQRLSHLF